MLWKGFQKPKRLIVNSDSNDRYAAFSAQPFERGFGTTIGNALRRVLLSSIEGAAITAVKIEGVLHEFSSIPGVVEDATDVILNLKQIPLKLHGDEPQADLPEGHGAWQRIPPPTSSTMRISRSSIRTSTSAPSAKVERCRSRCASRMAGDIFPRIAISTKSSASATFPWIPFTRRSAR